MSRFVRSVFAIIVLLSLLGVSSADAQRVNAHCIRQGLAIECDVRTDQPRPITSIVTQRNGRALESTFERFNPSAGVAYYFLIQQTAHPSDSYRMIERITEAKMDSRRHFAIGAFTQSLIERVPFTVARKDITDARTKTGAPTGTDTNLYKAANAAIQRLVAFGDAKRKALVIFGDGRVTNKDSREVDAFVAAVKDNNILVYTVLTPTTQGSQSEFQSLRDRIGSIQLTTANCSNAQRCTDVDLPAKDTSEFTNYLEGGGRVRLSSTIPSTEPFTVLVSYDDNSTARDEKVTCCATGPAQQDVMQQVMAWVTDNAILAFGGGAVILGALVFGLSQLSGRGGSGATSYEPDGKTGKPAGVTSTLTMPPDTILINTAYKPNVGAAGSVYARLEFLDADSRRVDIGSTNVRIGRGQDNDIILNNKSVHRQHAIIKRTPEGRFSVHHIGGENVVAVNGQKGTQHELHDNDMIELGEVRMRFFINA